jgi:hypothetical protein
VYTMLDAAVRVLLEVKQPLHYKEIWERVNSIWISNREKEAKTPWNTVNAGIGKEIRLAKNDSRFAKYGPGIYGLNPAKFPSFGIHANMVI